MCQRELVVDSTLTAQRQVRQLGKSLLISNQLLGQPAGSSSSVNCSDQVGVVLREQQRLGAATPRGCDYIGVWDSLSVCYTTHLVRGSSSGRNARSLVTR